MNKALQLRILICSVFLLFLSCSTAQGKKDTLAAIDLKVEQLMDDFNIPGVSLAIVKDHKPFLAKGYGIRHLETKAPVDEHTLFSIASCSKAFTAAGLAHLVEAGRLDWERPVSEFMPDFKMADDYATTNITVKDMLAHRSGLARNDLIWYNSGLDRFQIFDRLAYLPMSNPLYKNYEYNNVMYVVAGVILEKIAATSLEDYITKNILQLLEMKETVWFNADMKQSGNYATSYLPDEEDNLIASELYPHGDVTAAAGGIKTSAQDMTNWLIFQLNKGTFKGRSIIAEKLVDEMQKGNVLIRDSNTKEIGAMAYGLGWARYLYRGHDFVDHTGAREGYWSQVNLLPKDGLAIYVNSNSGAASTAFVEALSYTLTDYLLGLPPIDWSQRNWEKQKKGEEERAMMKAKMEEALSSTLKPEKEVKAYTGTFQHPAYGNLVISVESGGIKALFRGTEYLLLAQPGGLFFGKSGNEHILLGFRIAANGTIDSLQTDFQGASVQFLKK
ncbi:MAG: serine hydrolase [Maribacter sp.]